MITKISFTNLNNNPFKQLVEQKNKHYSRSISSVAQNNSIKDKNSLFKLQNIKNQKTKYLIAVLGLIFGSAAFLNGKKIVEFFSLFKKIQPDNLTIKTQTIEKEIAKKSNNLENVQEVAQKIKKDIAKEKEQIEDILKNAPDDKKIDYFNEMLFSHTSIPKNTEEKLQALDMFEKYGLNLKMFPKYNKNVSPLSDSFRSSDNVDFFRYVKSDMPKELKNKYIEVFNKYIKIRPEEVSEDMIDSMKFPIDIENIKNAIEKIEDENKRNHLLGLFAGKIEKRKENPNAQLFNDFLKSTEKYLYPMIKTTPEDEAMACKKYGKSFGLNLISKTFYPLSKETLLSFALRASENEKNYKYCSDNFKYIALLSNSGSIIQNFSVKQEAFKTLVENAKDFLNGNTTLDDINAIINYTNMGQYDTINGSLRFFAKIDEMIKELEQEKTIKNTQTRLFELERIMIKISNLGETLEIGFENKDLFLDKFIDIEKKLNKNDYNSQDLIKDLNKLKSLVQEKYKNSSTEETTNILNNLLDKKVLKNNSVEFVRYENADIFNQLSLNNQSLCALMQDETKKDEVLNFLNSEKPTLTQASYLSTSIHPYSVKMRPNIKWHLKGDENTKGYYLTDIRNIFEYYGKKDLRRTEAEFLFAPNSHIKIEKATHNGKGYEIEGIVSHTS